MRNLLDHKGLRQLSTSAQLEARFESLEQRRMFISHGYDASTYDIAPTPAVTEITVGNTRFFARSDANHGNELWKQVNGQNEVLVTDLTPGGADSNPTRFVQLDGTVYFLAHAGSDNMRYLYSTDGTAAGTKQIRALQIGDAYHTDDKEELIVSGDRLLFAINTLTTSSLGSLDGTSYELYGQRQSRAQTLFDVNGTAWCSAYTPVQGRTGLVRVLWKLNLNGTAETLFLPVVPGGNSHGSPLEVDAMYKDGNNVMVRSGNTLYRIDAVTQTPVLANTAPSSLTVVGSNFDQATNTLSITFSKDVSASLQASDLTVTNPGRSLAVTLAAYDSATNTATFTFSNPIANRTIYRGNYVAHLQTSSIQSPDGDPLDTDFTLPLTVTTGVYGGLTMTNKWVVQGINTTDGYARLHVKFSDDVGDTILNQYALGAGSLTNLNGARLEFVTKHGDLEYEFRLVTRDHQPLPNGDYYFSLHDEGVYYGSTGNHPGDIWQSYFNIYGSSTTPVVNPPPAPVVHDYIVKAMSFNAADDTLHVTFDLSAGDAFEGKYLVVVNRTSGLKAKFTLTSFNATTGEAIYSGVGADRNRLTSGNYTVDARGLDIDFTNGTASVFTFTLDRDFPLTQTPVAGAPADYAGVLSNGVLTFTGTSKDDYLVVTRDRRNLNKIEVTRAIRRDFQQTFIYDASQVRKISISTGAGNDYIDLRGMAVGAEVIAGDGNDTVFGSQGDDTLYGGAGNDGLYGNEGHDQIYGMTGLDALYGGAGKDFLDGGQDADRISGGDGDDEIVAGQGADNINGNAGRDRIYGTVAFDSVARDRGDKWYDDASSGAALS